MSKILKGFRYSLKAIKDALSSLRANIKLENIDLNLSITPRLTKLQNDLAAENKIMDALAEQRQKTKVLNEKMKNASTTIQNLEEDKLFFKSHPGCFRKRGFFETRGRRGEILKRASDPKDNEASGFGKGKVVSKEDIEENVVMTELEKEARERRDKELDELDALRQKVDAKEADIKNTKPILENQKSLFPAWSLERIQKEAIDDLNLYWLEPTTSFNTNNDVECQLDLPITPRVFLFQRFKKIKKIINLQ
ncbi:unnamed protein product [Lactuca saligna]|uniref:Uncharacterized protein n=1 Tax=Lactuca saligna TaxID=75948 RepID=A0AA36A206_LACSI|nr:unnamed protein product [Lactuca saligna]